MTNHNTPRQPKPPTPLERWKWCYTVMGQLTAVQAAVLLRIASFEKVCFESHANIGAMIHYERRTVLEACKVLMRLGLIVQETKRLQSNTYRVTMSLRTTPTKLKKEDRAVSEAVVEDDNPTCRPERQGLSSETTGVVVQDDTRGGREGGSETGITPPLPTPGREDPKTVALRIAAEYMSEGRGFRP